MASDHFWREILLLLLVWQLIGSIGLWQTVWKYEQQAKKRRPERKKRAKRSPEEFQGLTKKPDCELCQGDQEQETGSGREAPPKLSQKRGRPRQVDSSGQYCPNLSCAYYGWLKRGNIRANGHPGGGEWRQFHCSGCDTYFLETKGTLFYGKRLATQLMLWAVAAMAEGLGPRAVGRVFAIEPETALAWLVAASQQLALFSAYQMRELQLEQVQLDELYARISTPAIAEGSQTKAERRSSAWLWTALDPVSKLWLTLVVGPRSLACAQQLVHQVEQMLAPGCVPLFVTDGLRHYQTALLTHFGQWLPRHNNQGRRLKPRWLPLPELDYAQLIKKRRRRRLVGISRRVIFGSLERIKLRLAAHGWQINTAFIERLNLNIRQHVSGLGRRVLRLAKSSAGLRQQTLLYQSYYNFCLVHASLRRPLGQPQPSKGPASLKKWQPCSPAMAAGLTDRVWTLRELLLFRVPPWPQPVAASRADD